MQVATEARLTLPTGGAPFVSLAPLSQPDLVLPTLAQTLDLKETSDWLPLEHLKAYLREKQRLLAPVRPPTCDPRQQPHCW